MNEIFGYFSGEQFISDAGKLYPIPGNYISKSKLLTGDRMKIVDDNGNFLYKNIAPVIRRNVVVIFERDLATNRLLARTPTGRLYKIHSAALTFYHVQAGDEAWITIPKDMPDVEYAAIEGMIRASN